MQLSNPWFDQSYRVAQSRLFLAALRVRKQFLYENRTHLRTAASVWNQQEKYLEQKSVIEAAWNWINLAIPVISSTFASFSRMCRNLGTETLGHLFIDEAGQALPIPVNVFVKPPSAELAPGQVDEASMGIDYPTLDGILAAHLDRGLDAGALVKAGFDAEQVSYVLGRAEATAFKRALEPPFAVPPALNSKP